MDFRQLRYFIAIAETGSFSRAAGKLLVAQPALSQHILKMEAELGVPLFLRSSRGVQLTEAGQLLLEEARAIQLRFEGLRDRILGHEAAPRGEVRFGMPSTISEQLGVQMIETAQTRYPAIDLRISEAMSGFILNWLREDIVDVAVLFDMPEMRGLTRNELLTEEIALFAAADAPDAPKGDKVTLRSALRLPLILPGRRHGLRTLIDACALSIGEACEPRTEIDSYRQIKQLVARGSYYSMLPMVAITPDVRLGNLQAWRLTRPAVKRHVFLARRSDKPFSAGSRAITDLAWMILRKNVLSGDWQARWTGGDSRPS